MSASPRRAIVAFPKIETQAPWARLLALRERFDPLASFIPAHVTLAFPFEDPAPSEALEGEIVRALGDLAPFRIVLRGVTAYEGEYLFLNVKRGNDTIIELHDALYRGALAAYRSRLHTFVPHITVGRATRSTLGEALEASAGYDDDIVGTIDRVSLYEIAPSGARTITFEAPLGAERP